MHPTNQARNFAEPTESLGRRRTPGFPLLHGPAAPPEAGHSPPELSGQGRTSWPVPPWCLQLPRKESAPSTATDKAPHAATSATSAVASRPAPCQGGRAKHPRHDADESRHRPVPLPSLDQVPAGDGPGGSVLTPHPHRPRLQPPATPSMPAGVAQFQCSQGWSRAMG